MTGRPNRDPNGEWKAIVLSYDDIFSLSEKKCAYCLTEQEAMALVQVAEYLSWQTRWIDAALGKDRDKLAAFAAGIQRTLMSGCCGDEQDFLIRYDDEGLREISYDGGVTWQPDPEPDPRFIGTYYPISPAAPPEDDIKCWGAQNIVEWFQYQQTKTADAMGLGGGVAAIIAAILSIIVLYVGVTLTAGLATPLLIGLASALAVTTAEAFNAAMTEDVYDRLLCTIYCNISDDGSFTQAQWQAIKTQLIEDEGGIAFRFLFDNVNTLGTIGLSNIARTGAATDYDCSSCVCGECVDPERILIGTLLSQTENTITIESELILHNGVFAYWFVYGSEEVDYCCLLCAQEYSFSPSSGGWSDCDQVAHDGTSPVGEMIGNVRAYSTAGQFTVTLTFPGDDGCPP